MKLASELTESLIALLAIVVAITVHEFAHAFAAVNSGDNTPKEQNRLNVNPVNHFDRVGFIMIAVTVFFGFGIGWGKPVMVNPLRFRNPRWDDIKVAAWGPLSNICQAILAVILIKAVLQLGILRGAAAGFALIFLFKYFIANIGLACFNMVPLPPLDGSHILANILPIDMGRKYAAFARNYGIALLMFLVLTGTIGKIIGPPIMLLQSLLFKI